MSNSTKAIVQNFITFTGIHINTVIDEFNLSPDEWLRIKSGEELPGIELMAKMLAYSMDFRQDVKRSLSSDLTPINDRVAIEAEQLEAITNLIHGNQSQAIRQIGNLIAGPVSRLSALTQS